MTEQVDPAALAERLAHAEALANEPFNRQHSEAYQLALKGVIAALRQRSQEETPASGERGTCATDLDFTRALGDVVAFVISFNERTQMLRCRMCGSEPELGKYGRLHREGCAVYKIQDYLVKIGATKDRSHQPREGDGQ